MSSFYAELEAAGQTYPITQCQYGFDQPAGSGLGCATACYTLSSTCPTTTTSYLTGPTRPTRN
jgi:hypothetical protein